MRFISSVLILACLLAACNSNTISITVGSTWPLNTALEDAARPIERFLRPGSTAYNALTTGVSGVVLACMACYHSPARGLLQSNQNLTFANDNARIMSARLATAIDTLAKQWPSENNGSTLLVLKAYLPPPTNISVRWTSHRDNRSALMSLVSCRKDYTMKPGLPCSRKKLAVSTSDLPYPAVAFVSINPSGAAALNPNDIGSLFIMAAGLDFAWIEWTSPSTMTVAVVPDSYVHLGTCSPCATLHVLL